MSYSPELVARVIAEIRNQRGSPHRAAVQLRLAPTVVFDIFEKHRHEIRRRPETYGGLGRPQLQHQIVARTKATAGWDNNQPEIKRARAEYAAGLVELVTGRDGDWLILYSQRRERIARGREQCWALARLS